MQWVCDLLRNELLSGDWAEEPLPAEDALIRKYGVSRGIIRDALAILAEQGLVERVRGAGTFALAPSALQHEIDVSRDLAQEMNTNGTRVAIRTTYAALHPAPSFIAERLEITAGAEVVILESVTSLDGFPLSIRSAFMPGDPFAGLLDGPASTLNRSPYELIADVLREPVGDTELQVGCSGADPISAGFLQVEAGFALLDSSRIIRALDGRPLEYSVSHARSDRIVYATVMRSFGDRTGEPPRRLRTAPPPLGSDGDGSAHAC
ncbi:GntR family transcriptional regulator [Kribbella sp.]|uniref:GntR family transcriptional regulator n=1 Tax=Kribbella sp. TaxID=1871183 RepID=UPI002D750FF5|nr:GntR family transcriptional regulator [Kribbella sp.]HZX04750.1 GntR family transcriptional regulator [Kribbella sp.]